MKLALSETPKTGFLATRPNFVSNQICTISCVTMISRHPVHPFTLGRIAQSVTCLATDACLTADQGVASSIPVRPHTFVEIDHEMILLLLLIHSRRVVVSYKRKYVHELLVKACLDGMILSA